MDVLEKINKKLNRLYELLKKYEELSKLTNGQYRWRCEAIYAQIEALEQLRDDTPDTWDICYKEDLAETKHK